MCVPFFYSNVPDEDFKNICSLAHTFGAMQQANVEVRTKRPELISMIGSIVNGKRTQGGEHEIKDEIGLFRRIQRANSCLQLLENTDQREVRRILWMNHQFLKLHYSRWEEVLVGLGMARQSETEEEREQGGLVVLCPERITQPDEVGLTMNGDDERAGGRPAMAFVAESVSEAGEPTQKTSSKCTILQAINFADEALPPFVTYPSSAKAEAKLNTKVEGQCGFASRHWFDCYVSKSPNGSMTGRLWKRWVTEIIPEMYPDVADRPGKRVLIKADSGPGKRRACLCVREKWP